MLARGAHNVIDCFVDGKCFWSSFTETMPDVHQKELVVEKFHCGSTPEWNQTILIFCFSEMDELKASLPRVQEELAQARASLPGIKEKEDRLMEEVSTS